MKSALSQHFNARVYATISPDAVAHNLLFLRSRATGRGRTPRVWATVKADAYGHGIANVLPGLKTADGLAVLSLEEAQRCRASGWGGPILVYGGLMSPGEADLLGSFEDLHLVISQAAQMDWLAASHGCAWIWLRFAGDLRMLGFDSAGYACAYARATTLVKGGLARGVGHLNHYAAADQPDRLAEADAHFRHVIAGLPGPVSTCNSAAIWITDGHAADTDWIRPGLALYGASPFGGIDGSQLGLLPAMELRSRIRAIRPLQAGESIGYHGSHTATAPTRVGLVSCGYADGYPRLATSGTPALVKGKPAHLLGQVSMDMLAVDLTALPDVQVADPVLLWGAPAQGVGVEAVARAAGTIAADLLTNLTARVAISALPFQSTEALASLDGLAGARTRNSSVASR